MTTVQERPEAAVLETTQSTEQRKAALASAVEKLTAEGWTVESRPDYQRVLVGHNEFRVALVRRRLGIHDRRELVEVDKEGRVSVRKV